MRRPRTADDDEIDAAIEEDKYRYEDVNPGLHAASEAVFGNLPPPAPPAPSRRNVPLPCPSGCAIGPRLALALEEGVGTQAVRPDDADPRQEKVILQLLDETPAEPVSWLWPGRIPLGKFTLLVGDPGVGKSLLSLDLAARVTRGDPWPDAPDVPQRKAGVLLLSAEDNAADTIRPRLERAGGRLGWIQVVRGLAGKDENKWKVPTWQRPIVLPDDVAAIERLLMERPYDRTGPPPQNDELWWPPIRLVVIDPLSAYFPAANSHDNVQVRKLLQPLVDVAARYQTAIVGITHLNKSSSQPGRYRAMGSLAFTAVARAVWGVARDSADPERRWWLPIKNNLGPTPDGLSFRIVDGKVDWETSQATPEWTAAIDDRAETRRERRSELEEAITFLQEVLADGEQPVVQVKRLAARCGIGAKALVTARRKLAVSPRKEGFGALSCWFISLPK